MNQQKLINNTVAFVQDTLAGAESGHDWYHIERVWKNAKAIAQAEPVDLFVVELGALLHDIAEPKFHGGDEDLGPKVAEDFLTAQNVPADIVAHVKNIIRHISFKKTFDEDTWTSPELQVVQDADRLDAIGAIGIARTFMYGGHKNNQMHDPDVKPNLNMDKTTYKAGNTTVINHFYEKLLKLKDLMNTETGKQLAEERHQFMENFLTQFHAEWNGEK